MSALISHVDHESQFLLAEVPLASARYGHGLESPVA